MRASDAGIWRMARVDPCAVTRHGICVGTRRMDDVCQEGKFLADCPSMYRYVADEDVGFFRGDVCDILAQQG